MRTKADDKELKDTQTAPEVNEQDEPQANACAEDTDEQLSEEELQAKKIEELSQQVEKEKKEYLFLMAEFDNFRKRTIREKAEIIKNGAESAMKDILPVVDDFERGLAAINDSSDVEALKEGMHLIYNKFVKYLEQHGVKEIPTADQPFDTEFNEAIALVPAQDESMKGKIIDTVSKGYTMNDKVIRHAKVAVAQ